MQFCDRPKEGSIPPQVLDDAPCGPGGNKTNHVGAFVSDFGKFFADRPLLNAPNG